MGDVLYRAEDLCRSFGTGKARIDALRDVSFTVEAGAFMAITGASGSGKSTLLNLLGVLDTPSAGALSVAGRDIGSLSQTERAARRNADIGFVFQSFQLLPRANARDNVALPLLYAGVAPVERHQRAAAALEQVGLTDRALHMPSQLSGGEQQRVAIARAIVNAPAVILADEPTGALDSRTGSEIMDLLRDLNASGTSVIFITHDLALAARADRRIVLADGCIVSGA